MTKSQQVQHLQARTRTTFKAAIILLIVAGLYTLGVAAYTTASLVFSGPPSEHRTVELQLDYGTQVAP